ncbi:MAG: hypothetical protein D6772_04175 [Bacteroidetes bacterium]|nr:MAG: hypothetical protein D6772_04175 [Bacteroidota bacterium]
MLLAITSFTYIQTSMKRLFSWLSLSLLIISVPVACQQTNQEQTTSNSTHTGESASSEVGHTEEGTSATNELAPLPPSTNTSPVDITPELIALETEYHENLAPVASLKTTHPEIYWFMVSWLKTAYKTPDWDGYTDDHYEAWRVATKARGIDCSGFTRVMLDQMFDQQVAGGRSGYLINSLPALTAMLPKWET